MIHKLLKIEDCHLNNLLSGARKSEIRLNDRDYQNGDILEFIDDEKTSESLNIVTHSFKITHVHSGFGLNVSFVALSLVLINQIAK